MREAPPLLQQEFARLRENLSQRFLVTGDRMALRVRAALAKVEAHLCRPLRIAVAGEQNVGKSSVINLLLRESVVPAGALAGMRAHLLLRHGTEPGLYAIAGDGVRARLTSGALARVTAPQPRRIGADAPTDTAPKPSAQLASAPAPAEARRGAGALPGGPRPPADSTPRLIEIVSPHDFLRRAELVEMRSGLAETPKSTLRHAVPVDLAVWCTIAVQAWKETERQAWRRLPTRVRKDGILLVTYKDAIDSAKNEGRLMTRLQNEAGSAFGAVVLISLRQAGEAIGQLPALAERGKWEKSGAAAFEQLLLERLAAVETERRARSIAMLRRFARIMASRIAGSSQPSRQSGELAGQFEALIRHVERMAG